MTRVVNHFYEFGNFRVDPCRRLLLCNEAVIPLPPKVFDTLLVLLENPGRVLEKEMLMRQIWNSTAVEEVGLAKNISALRKALGESPGQHQYIVTVPGRGYRFVADVTTAPRESGEVQQAAIETLIVSPIIKEEEVSEPTVIGARRARFGRREAAILLGILLAVGAGLFFYFRNHPALTDRDTILLADFVNQTGDPVFDVTLKQGLAVQLEQSPLLNIFPDERVRETLRLMARPPDQPLTPDVAREICQRQGLKALIMGWIAPLGSHYAITLKATDSRSGEILARIQVEAGSKEQILKALSQAASGLRGELGESVRSIQRFDALLERTTPSLEALRAYSLGFEERSKGNSLGAIPFFRQAIELDPNFASAYVALAVLYSNARQPGLTSEYAAKAYALRDHANEHERLAIMSLYYGQVTGELDKRIEVLKLHQKSYPLEAAPHSNLATTYNSIGQFEQAVEESRTAIRLSPHSTSRYAVLGNALVHLNRFVEAGGVYRQALEQHLDTVSFHEGLFWIAFVNGNCAGMQQQIQWAGQQNMEYIAFNWQAGAAAYFGGWRRSTECSRRAIDAVVPTGATYLAAEYAAQAALRAAALGRCAEVKTAASQALSIGGDPVSLTRAAMALAWCGESSQAALLMDELSRRYPRHTVVNGIWLPTIRAAVELKLGHAESAVELLRPVARYEAAAEFWPQYKRGQACLHLEKGGEAEAEFRKILDHRGQGVLSPLYPLSRFGLARAAALRRDMARARKSYADFLAEWRDADPDLPVLAEARKDAENLR